MKTKIRSPSLYKDTLNHGRGHGEPSRRISHYKSISRQKKNNNIIKSNRANVVLIASVSGCVGYLYYKNENRSDRRCVDGSESHRTTN